MSNQLTYLVWAFRRTLGCYECDKSDATDFSFPTEHVELDSQAFDDFVYAIKRNGSYDYVYLYQAKGAPQKDGLKTIHELVEKGRNFRENEEIRKVNLALKQAKTQEQLEKKKLKKEKERLLEEKKQYEQLKKKFEG